ncbi:cytochrome P450 [Ophiobolus disseminans]|uniref:Cytochrome P450 n=1 Tax=Ophiobolus disseminans TaxID=1469910 RepID=A0A6A7A220_9PLEO|nr:cytochrome P450 [Ophiobolus disseminans]
MALSTIAMGAIGLAIAIAALLVNLARVKIDPREPPVVHPKVPFFGHVIGMLTGGPLYVKKISEQCKHPFFTLPMLNGRTYVCTSPAIAVAVQRAASTLDFDALIAELGPRMVGAAAETQHILRDPMAKQQGRRTMVDRSHDIINPPLAAHKMLEIAQKQVNYLSNFVNAIQDGEELDLFVTMRGQMAAASMDTFYGPHNPFAEHPELLDKYWDWDDGLVGFMVNVLPQITARRAYYAMQACVKGWVEYTEKGLHREAQPFLQDRKRFHEDEGISQEEHARLEMGITFGIVSNASVTSFWLVNNIFSDPELLSQVRDEIYTNAFEAPGTLSTTKLRDACPLLNSTWRETMRLIAPMTSARIVLQDTVLSDTYFLRKGSVVQIAGGLLHSDTEIWGPDAASFNPRRFVYNWNGTKTESNGRVVDSKSNAIHPGAFRGFGGGTSLCPGRHFAQAEITSLAAMLVLGFDMHPMKGAREVMWNPPRDDKRFPIAVTKPLRGVPVMMRRRNGWEEVKLELKV